MLVVVGGHTRNIGKTSVVAGLIAALPEARWTAMKITQFGHGICSRTGSACECSLVPECPYSITRELEPNASDSGRFLAAGARMSYWVRTAMGQLANALPAIAEIRAADENLIIESNSIVEFLKPDAYLVVLDFAQPDFKTSSARWLGRADAFVVIERDRQKPAWGGAAGQALHQLPRFPAQPPQYVTPELVEFVRARWVAGIQGRRSSA